MSVRNQLKSLALLTVLAPIAATAQSIELVSPDQSVRITGELVNFDGANYIISTSLGELTFAASAVQCIGDACPYIKPPTSEFAISGSKSLSEMLIPALINSYANQLDSRIGVGEIDDGQLFTITDSEDDALAKIEIYPSNSSTGLSELLQGDSSIALATRPARARETRAFEASNLGDVRQDQQEHVLALDGLLIITSPDNPVRAISQENAALVFGGEINNWSELGGPDAPIKVYTRPIETGTGEQFDFLLLRSQGLSLRGDATEIGSDDEISRVVAADPFGIGFTSFAHVKNAKPLAIEGVCGLQIPATEFAIKTEEYPLTRRLFAYSAERDDPHHVKEFLNFAKSNFAQDAVQKAGFINHSISTASVDTQGLRFASAIIANRNASSLPELKRMVADMLSSDRLSTTFRFLTGSSNLDTRATADIVRLAEELQLPQHAGKVVQLIGFTDSIGDPLLNKQLSERRAFQIRDALLEANSTLEDHVKFTVAGYGEVSPLGCNETNQGRLINRRVEVWLKEDLEPASN